jgi:hypothetical protein
VRNESAQLTLLMLDEIGGRPPLAVLQPLLIGEVARL